MTFFHICCHQTFPFDILLVQLKILTPFKKEALKNSMSCYPQEEAGEELD